MTCTYDPTLPTNRDWVRLLVGDTNTPNCSISDEEIDAIISESVRDNGTGEWTKYCAAADALALLAQSGALIEASDGVERKRVGRLELERGAGTTAMKELREREKRLRVKCVSMKLRKPAAFSTLGRKRGRCKSCG